MKQKSIIKNTNYINIQGFMVNQLGLDGEQLIVYALIYGFSQDEGSWFTGSLQYIANWIHKDRKNVYPRYLKPLVDNNLLERKEETANGILYVKYRAIVPSWVVKSDGPQNEGNDLKKDNSEDDSQNEDTSNNCEECSQNESTALKLRKYRPQNENEDALKTRDNNKYLNSNGIKDIKNSTSTNSNESLDNEKSEIYNVEGMLVSKERKREIDDLIQMIGGREIENSSKDALFNFLRKLYDEKTKDFYENKRLIKNLKSFIKNCFNRKTDLDREERMNKVQLNKFTKEDIKPDYSTNNNQPFDKDEYNRAIAEREERKQISSKSNKSSETENVNLYPHDNQFAQILDEEGFWG